MEVTCIIMAGGKSTRMESHDEKTVIPILGKPMIEYVIEAANGSNVNQIIVATSSNAPKTSNLIKKFDLEIFETAGEGYHEDLSQILENFDLEIVLIISGDFPLISSSDINRIITFHEKSKKFSLSVMARVEDFEKFNLKPTYVMDYQDQKLVPVGINVIDGRKNTKEWQEEAIMLVSEPQFLINVNTKKDLEIVEKYLIESKKE
ncbi:MAG: NTP transferase domain-containing protein [Candidatus Helarchaeota archaeon]|nr:NTP transferase domain-containing protein [Candidatus Helarchaeota archaeon]